MKKITKVNYEILKDLNAKGTLEVREYNTSGKGRYSKIVNNTVFNRCVDMGLTVVREENDAPRNGKLGAYTVFKFDKRSVLYKEFNKMLEKENKKLELKKQEQKEKLNNLNGTDLLKEYFKDEVHPAPKEVAILKIESGFTWGQLRNMYSN